MAREKKKTNTNIRKTIEPEFLYEDCIFESLFFKFLKYIKYDLSVIAH